MSEWKILIADGLDPSGQDLLRSAAQVDDRTGITAEELLHEIPGYQALIVRSRTRVSQQTFAAARALKVVGRAGVGVDNIDLQAAAAQGVIVVNTPQASTTAVAEHTLALMLALARSIPRADLAMKAGEWIKKDLEGIELSGKVLGLIGVGHIGHAVSQRAVAFGIRVMGFDPLLPSETLRQRGVEPVSLGELYARSDFISIHVPLTAETRGMVDAQALRQMKPGIRIICTARGGLIDESALLAALEAGQVAGAALDVYSVEPPGATSLVLHPNVIATPHISAQTAEAQTRAAVDIAREVLAALQGRPLRWRVS
jgi:D-3-phosphoglycerate dehydrogenase / 2-oxoglutarate reductase